jgi:hypothetical protein
MPGRLQTLGAERFIALLLIIFAAAELYGAVQLSLSEEFTLGPGALPVIYAVGLLIFAVTLAIWPSQNARPIVEGTDVKEEETLPIRNYRDGIVTFTLVALFIFSIYFVGFLGGTIMFSLLYVLLIARWSVLQATAFAVIWGGAVYYGFDRLLGVQLEQGILFAS